MGFSLRILLDFHCISCNGVFHIHHYHILGLDICTSKSQIKPVIRPASYVTHGNWDLLVLYMCAIENVEKESSEYIREVTSYLQRYGSP